jgi:hypothetical protein
MHFKTISTPFFIFCWMLLNNPFDLAAQKGDVYLKFGTSVFGLANAQQLNHVFSGLGASCEYQYSNQVSWNLNVNAARNIAFKVAEGENYIRSSNGVELEIRFYPNQKGKGFFAGVSGAFYRDRWATYLAENAIPLQNNGINNHWGSHINLGFQHPINQRFYYQINAQTGIFYFRDKSYATYFNTISRDGLNMMVAYRL